MVLINADESGKTVEKKTVRRMNSRWKEKKKVTNKAIDAWQFQDEMFL